MITEVAIIAAAAAGVGGFFLWRRRRTAGAQAELPAPATVWNIGPGDLVEVEGTMMDVERTLDCSEGGIVWRELLLANRDRSEKIWLAVEDDDGLVLTRSRPVEAPAELASGYPRTVELDGLSFELEEKGRARARLRALDVPEKDVTFTYAVWLGPGDERLSVEQWGGDVDWHLGAAAAEELVDVYGGAS